MTHYFINDPNNDIPENKTTEILKQSKAWDYHKSLNNYHPTPFVQLNYLSKKYGVGNIYIKDEAPRLGLNAFKGLGASFAIFEVLKTAPSTSTFCTATDGNHGRAVAWASASFGKKSVVYVPKDTTKNRIDAIAKEGAKVIQLNKNYDQTCAYAAQKSKEEGWKLIQDTATVNYKTIPALIMAGYLTQFKELESSIHTQPLPKIDLVFLQAGVGSFAGSAIWYYLSRYGSSRPKIVIVEPFESCGILASFIANKRANHTGNQQTIMAGLNCGIPSLTAWELIKNGSDAAMRIKDYYAEKAMKTLFYPNGSDQQIIAGESGSGGLAGFLAMMSNPQFAELKEQLNISNQSNILFYNTEGATDMDNYDRIINKT